MRVLFWNLAGVVWFMGHLQYNVKGASGHTTNETWDLSRHWVEGKING